MKTIVQYATFAEWERDYEAVKCASCHQPRSAHEVDINDEGVTVNGYCAASGCEGFQDE